MYPNLPIGFLFAQCLFFAAAPSVLASKCARGIEKRDSPFKPLTNTLGFVGGMLGVGKPTVVDVLQNTADLAAKYPDHSIVATGHSLGAARASMFVADLSVNFPQLVSRVQMYTYGQVKVGNSVFAKYIDGLGVPIYRVVNKGDIAPHLPFGDSNFAHFGTEVWITADNGTIVCQSGDYGSCSESLPPAAYNIADHSTYPGL